MIVTHFPRKKNNDFVIDEERLIDLVKAVKVWAFLINIFVVRKKISFTCLRNAA